MSAWRLLTDLDVGAADGLAADEALMLHYGRASEPCEHAAALRLYTYRPDCALVGRYQELISEVNLNACSALGVEVCRRPTGGGAIIMGPGQLGIAVTTCAPTGLGPRDLLRQYAEGIITGLATVGVRARFRGKNDLEVQGRKVAGLGLYLDERGALLFHASVLADLDVELMLSLLRIPGAKLADKGVARVADRITTVTRETGSLWSGADLREAIADGFRETLGVELANSRLDAAERVRAGELIADRYGEPAWLAGRSIALGRRATAALKTPEGLIRVYAAVQGDVLSSVLLAGDFSVMPPGLLRFEAALRWCRADPGRIADVARAELAGDELGVSGDELAGAVWSAAERALERAGGAVPVRTEGSCYFPERVAVG